MATIEQSTWRHTNRLLLGGATVVLAHVVGEDEHRLRRVVQLCTRRGKQLALVLSSAEWREIDRLETE